MRGGERGERGERGEWGEWGERGEWGEWEWGKWLQRAGGCSPTKKVVERLRRAKRLRRVDRLPDEGSKANMGGMKEGETKVGGERRVYGDGRWRMCEGR